MMSIFRIQFQTNGAPDPLTVVLLFRGEDYEKARKYAIKVAKQRNWHLKRIEETWINRSGQLENRTKYLEQIGNSADTEKKQKVWIDGGKKY